MRIAILTGDERRHRFVRSAIAADSRFTTVAAICEGTEKSLGARTAANPNAGRLEQLHVAARDQSEQDFFGVLPPETVPLINIPKGRINDDAVVARIKDLNCDLLVCFGSSLICSDLLKVYEGRFLNVHLGLSPYYRGSGTNVWPMVNRELHMVGATFMLIDAGIDTGTILHQIRAEVFLGDGPHTIGNRLIKNVAAVYSDVIASFDRLTDETQLQADGRLYKQADWNEDAARRLYQNFKGGMVEDHLTRFVEADHPPIISNTGLICQ